MLVLRFPGDHHPPQGEQCLSLPQPICQSQEGRGFPRIQSASRKQGQKAPYLPSAPVTEHTKRGSPTQSTRSRAERKKKRLPPPQLPPCLRVHEAWAATLPCPVLRTDGTTPVAENAAQVVGEYHLALGL